MVGIWLATAQLTPGGNSHVEIYPPLRNARLCSPRSRFSRRAAPMTKKGPDSVALGADSTLNQRSRAREPRHDGRSRSSRTFPRPRRRRRQRRALRLGRRRARRRVPRTPKPRMSARHDDHAEWQHGDDESENRRCERNGWRRGRDDSGRRDAHHERLVEDLHGNERGRRPRHGDGSRTRSPARTARRFPPARRST